MESFSLMALFQFVFTIIHVVFRLLGLINVLLIEGQFILLLSVVHLEEFLWKNQLKVGFKYRWRVILSEA